jgi:asparagine N-glycosylation enzyme membrane subunit Stt3
MKKQLVVVGIIVILLGVVFTGCTGNNNPKNGDERLISTEFLGGTYNTSILHLQTYWEDEGNWFDGTEMNYTKNGVEHQGCYIPSMKETLDWIKTNTSENCTILCWWDYGIMIEGYAERNVIARVGSLAITDTIAVFGSLDEEGKKKFIEEHEWTSNETIQELAMVLTTTNISSDETRAIIQKYNVSYIFTAYYDKQIISILLNAAGKNSDEYYTGGTPNEKCNETLIFKMWNDTPEISELELIYHQPLEDGRIVRIFKLV